MAYQAACCLLWERDAPDVVDEQMRFHRNGQKGNGMNHESKNLQNHSVAACAPDGACAYCLRAGHPCTESVSYTHLITV